MRLTEKKLKIMRWTARIIALAVLLLGLPFYFGYGNPLPFVKDYSFLENLWLTIMPLMFIGLGIGWKYEKIGGYIITVPITIGVILAVILEKEFFSVALLPLVSGIFYLIVGYKNKVNR